MAPAKIRREEKKEYVDETGREKRTTNGGESQTHRYDNISFQNVTFFALSFRMRAMHWCGPYSVATVLCVYCSVFLRLKVLHIFDERCFYSVVVNCFIQFFHSEAVFRSVSISFYFGFIFAFFRTFCSYHHRVFRFFRFIRFCRCCWFSVFFFSFYKLNFLFLIFHSLRLIIRS